MLVGFSGSLSRLFFFVLSQTDCEKILNCTNWLICSSVTRSSCITAWCTSPSETVCFLGFLFAVRAFDCLAELCGSLSAPWQTFAVEERCFFVLCGWIRVFIKRTDCPVMHINKNPFKIMTMKKEHKSDRLSSVNPDNSEVCRIYLISALVLQAFISVWIYLCGTVDFQMTARVCKVSPKAME